tara:strand:+ start:171 stop:350 length:180 start_codon:yes stop_codon:yes gene_type:complete
MGCMTSSPKTDDTTGDTTERKTVNKASRRDSVAVHKKHLAKSKTADSGAPAGVSVEQFD